MILKKMIIRFFLIFLLTFNVYAIQNPNSIIFETINPNGQVQYNGYYKNTSNENIKKLSLRYVLKNNLNQVIEAKSVSIIDIMSGPLGSDEKVFYNFTVDSKLKDIFERKLYFLNE